MNRVFIMYRNVQKNQSGNQYNGGKIQLIYKQEIYYTMQIVNVYMYR